MLTIHSYSLSSQSLLLYCNLGTLLTLSRSHRTRNIDPTLRLQRLNSYILPLTSAWGGAELTNSLSSFNSFCTLLGLDKAQDYMISSRVHEIKDFSAHQLDPHALALQTDLQEKFKVLPIRSTKAFITCSTEKLKKGSQSYSTDRKSVV